MEVRASLLCSCCKTEGFLKRSNGSVSNEERYDRVLLLCIIRSLIVWDILFVCSRGASARQRRLDHYVSSGVAARCSSDAGR